MLRYSLKIPNFSRFMTQKKLDLGEKKTPQNINFTENFRLENNTEHTPNNKIGCLAQPISVILSIFPECLYQCYLHLISLAI